VPGGRRRTVGPQDVSLRLTKRRCRAAGPAAESLFLTKYVGFLCYGRPMPIETLLTFAVPSRTGGAVAPTGLAGMAQRLARRGASLVDQVRENPAQRTGIRLFACADYDAWLLRWPPNTSVTPHDHGDSAGAFTVVSGELVELRWFETGPRARLVSPGRTIIIEQGVVHDVIAGPGPALSVHLYSPPLTAMSFYDAAGTEALRHEPVNDDPPALAWTRALHPAGSR
jgi:quercetin dioxygenase-like cupin family protein